MIPKNLYRIEIPSPVKRKQEAPWGLGQPASLSANSRPMRDPVSVNRVDGALRNDN